MRPLPLPRSLARDNVSSYTREHASARTSTQTLVDTATRPRASRSSSTRTRPVPPSFSAASCPSTEKATYVDSILPQFVKQRRGCEQCSVSDRVHPPPFVDCLCCEHFTLLRTPLANTTHSLCGVSAPPAILLQPLYRFSLPLHCIRSRHQVLNDKYDEAGYLALPPCLWGDADEGLVPSVFLGPNTPMISIKKNRNTNMGHYGKRHGCAVSLHKIWLWM
jgi:hypothetical protein